MSTATLKLDPNMKDRVQRVADSMRRTPHWVMKEAVEKYITDAERREAWEREIIGGAEGTWTKQGFM